MAPTTSAGSAAGIRRLLGRTVEDFPDTEVADWISETDRHILSKFGTKWMSDKMLAVAIGASGATSKTYTTFHPMKASTDDDVSVYVNGALRTLTTDYTVDTSASTVTFTASFSLAPDDVILIYYFPAIMDDYANYLSAAKIARTGLDVPGDKIQFISDELDRIETRLLSNPNLMTYTDHREDVGIW